MKKIGIILVVLMVALGAMGAGYAHWQQTLTVNEVINTGKFCMEFGPLPVSVLDTSKPPPYYPTLDPDWNASTNFATITVMDKDVAWGEAEYTDFVEDPHATGLHITLHDVYPWYYNHVDFWVHNCGTIPAWLPEVIVKNCQGVVVGHITADGQVVTIDLDGNGTNDFQILYGDHIGRAFQYNPCENINVSFGMLVLQDNDPTWQGKEFCFYLELPFVQYDYIPPG